MKHTWRDDIKPIVAKVLAENKDADEKTKRKALRDAYPFGEKKYHPYKIWIDEVRRQLGHKKGKKKTTGLSSKYKQLELFQQ